MTTAAFLRARLEAQIPAVFTASRRLELKSLKAYLPTGIAAIDHLTGGIPMGALTEICGSDLASSGKTSALVSLLAQASQEYFCALVDAGDSFDPVSAEAAGVNFSRLLWVRCGVGYGKRCDVHYGARGVRRDVSFGMDHGTPRRKLRPLEQAFKAADMLVQSNGFSLIVMDVSGVTGKIVRRVPLTSWFRFSRVVEKQNTALVVMTQQSHATSCAGLVLELTTRPAVWTGKLLTEFYVQPTLRKKREGWGTQLEGRSIQSAFHKEHEIWNPEKKPVGSARPEFVVKAQWA